MKKSKQSSKLYTIAALGIIGVAFVYTLVFGTSILNNIHNRYLRHLGDDVVRIQNSQGGGATGFTIRGKSGKAYIMTNAHVCKLAENNQLFVQYRDDTYLASVVKAYPMNDLCALEAPGTVGSTFSTAYTVRNGESVSVIGHPLLEPLSIKQGELSGTVQVHIAVAFNAPAGECDGPTYQRIDMSGTLYSLFGINEVCVRNLEADSAALDGLPGNSGSPVVNIFGSVVGVLFAGHESGTRSYIVPLKDLKSFLDTL